MKRILFYLVFLMPLYALSQNFSNWTGTGNWSNNGNWSSGTGYGQLQFQGAGSATNCVNDVSGMSQWRLYFNGSVAYNLTGSGSVNLFDFSGASSWVLSDATANQTINFPINFNDGGSRPSFITARNTGGFIFNGNLGTGGNVTQLRVANTNSSSSVSINTLSGNKPLIVGRDDVDANQSNTRVTLTGNSSAGYSGGITVQSGTLFVNGATGASSAVSVSSGNSATLAGSGSIGGSVSLSGVVSPGGTSNSTATLTTGSFTFNSNSSYRIEMNNATGTSGTANGWDRIISSGTITCSAMPITLNLVSLSVANFNPANNYTWPIASGSGVSGFNTSNFVINTSLFAPFTGTFAVTLSGGNTINLVYTAPTLAPAQPSAISGAINLCNGATQTYSVTDDPNATSYEWTLPNGWTGTSSTSSINVTVASPGGTISVIAKNASGDSLPSSLVVAVGTETSITTQPSASAQSFCLGSSVTPLTVVASGNSLTYQWYSNTIQSNSGGILLNGATSSSYTPVYVGGTTLFYYCVVGGFCAPTSVTSSVSGGITIAGLPNDSATYTITNGGNGGQGFGPWSFNVSGGNGGTFTGSSDIGTAWGLFANGGGLTSVVRPFAGPLALGNTVSFAFDNGNVDTSQRVGIRLRNSSNNILTEFRFIGGGTQYSIADATTTDTGINFTSGGLSNITFAYTEANTYSISITRSGITTVLTGRTFASVAGGSVPAQIEFFNSNAGGGSDKDVFFTDLSIGRPRVFVQPSNSAQAVCQNASATNLSVTAFGTNLGYQWFSNPGAILLDGQTSATFTPPTATAGTNTYYCVVSYTGTCGTAPSSTSSNSGNITVNPIPTLAGITSNSPICSGSNAVFTITGTSGSLVTYTGSVSGTVTLVGGTATITIPGVTADTTLNLTNISTANCTQVLTGISATVVVNTVPVTSSITGMTTACAGSTTSYSVANTAGSTYAWTITGGTQASGTNTNSITVTWGAAGTGSVSVVETNAALCSGTVVTLPVTVGAQPVWYTDADNDNYPSSAATVQSCTRPLNGKLASELTALTVDCNDNNAAINPGVAERCWNNIDDNCDGNLSEGCAPVVVNMATANNTVLPSFATGVAAQAYSFSGATATTYRFTIVNNQTLESQEVTSPTRFITIPLSMRNFNISYSVTAAAVIDGENVPYAGNTITVLSPIVPLVKLTPANCGVTLSAIGTNLSSTVGINAISYTFRARLTNDNGPTPTFYTVTQASRFVTLNSFPGLVPQFGTSYTIDVQYSFLDIVSNAVVQSGYGDACTVTTPSIPLIRLSSPTCGATVARTATISATPAFSALQYQFRIRLTSDNGPTPVYYFTNPSASRFSTLSSFQGLTVQFITSYAVSVRYKLLINSVEQWSDYGPDCTLTTVVFPTTEVTPSLCGQPTTALNQSLTILPVSGATIYRVSLFERVGEDLVPVGTIDRPVANFMLNMFAGATVNKDYVVTVSVQLNGEFGPDGRGCDIATLVARTAKVTFGATAYPNPFASGFMLDVTTSAESTPIDVKVYDMVGRLIEQKSAQVNELETMTIGDRYPSGVYNVTVTQGEEVRTVRVVKR